MNFHPATAIQKYGTFHCSGDDSLCDVGELRTEKAARYRPLWNVYLAALSINQSLSKTTLLLRQSVTIRHFPLGLVQRLERNRMVVTRRSSFLTQTGEDIAVK